MPSGRKKLQSLRAGASELVVNGSCDDGDDDAVR
jgi:hypothetical protein